VLQTEGLRVRTKRLVWEWGGGGYDPGYSQERSGGEECDRDVGELIVGCCEEKGALSVWAGGWNSGVEESGYCMDVGELIVGFCEEKGFCEKKGFCEEKGESILLAGK